MTRQLIFLLIFLLPTFACAQNAPLKLGFNWNFYLLPGNDGRVFVDPVVKPHGEFGLGVGLSFLYEFSPDLSLTFTPRFAIDRHHLHDERYPTTPSVHYYFGYIHIPIQLNSHFEIELIRKKVRAHYLIGMGATLGNFLDERRVQPNASRIEYLTSVSLQEKLSPEIFAGFGWENRSRYGIIQNQYTLHIMPFKDYIMQAQTLNEGTSNLFAESRLRLWRLAFSMSIFPRFQKRLRPQCKP